MAGAAGRRASAERIEILEGPAAVLCGNTPPGGLVNVISGLLAHPNIFKDEFSFRVRGPRRLQQVDSHNRLSVWTAPFQLAIALTGAFIGRSQVYGFMVAGVFFGGDTTAATRSLFLQSIYMTVRAATSATLAGPTATSACSCTHPLTVCLSDTSSARGCRLRTRRRRRSHDLIRRRLVQRGCHTGELAVAGVGVRGGGYGLCRQRKGRRGRA